MAEDKVIIGTLGGAFGVKGEVRLKSFCATPEDIVDYGPYEDQTGRVYPTLILTGQAKGGFTARVDGIATKEDADAARGRELLVPRDRLPQLPDDEFYYADLIGLDVVDAGGQALGKVKAVHDHGAGDLLEVHMSGASTTVLIPFTKASVPTVDLTARRIVVDPPEGILPS